MLDSREFRELLIADLAVARGVASAGEPRRRSGGAENRGSPRPSRRCL